MSKAGCSGGLGNIDHRHLEKTPPQKGWLVVKIGGPAYRIGMGGGAASSVASGSNKADLDFNAVQVGSHVRSEDSVAGKRRLDMEIVVHQLPEGLCSA